MRRHAPAEIERDERASIVGVGRTSRPLHTSSGHVDGSDLVAAFVREQKPRGRARTDAKLPLVRETSSQLTARSGARLVRQTRAGEVATVMLSFLSTRV